MKKFYDSGISQKKEVLQIIMLNPEKIQKIRVYNRKHKKGPLRKNQERA